MGEAKHLPHHEKEAATAFIITMLVYVFAEPVVGMVTESKLAYLIVKLLAVGTLMFYWRKWYTFALKFDIMAVLAGILIALLWIWVDPYYQHLSEPNSHVYTIFEIVLKICLTLIIAPVAEEFFTRFFLHRFVQEPDWLNAALGKFSWNAFIWTTVFFGFSHGRWLAGLIAGIAFNLLWYWKKDMNSVVTAHAVANLMLAIAVLAFGMWQFW